MTNNYIANIFLLAAFSACTTPEAQHATAHKEAPVDSSTAALAKPVNAQVVATIPVIKAQTGTRIVTATVNGVINYDTRNQISIASRVGGRVERLLIKYNYQPVRKGQLMMEIYAPDLAAAQRELLLVARQHPELLAAAKERLQLMGMASSQITQVLATGNILYRVPVYANGNGYILEKTAAAATTASVAAPATASGGDGMSSMGGGSAPTTLKTSASPATTPVMLREGQYVSAGQSLFTIYTAEDLVAEFSFPPTLATTVKVGQQLLFHPAGDQNNMHTVKIGLIEPVFRNGQNFTVVRVYLQGHEQRPGMLMTANIPVVYTSGWWLPKAAVWRLGNESIVFKKEKGVYVPVVVKTGAQADDQIQVNTNISDWEIAANAAYLVDSESFIKTVSTDKQQ
ncbi:MAG: efflux RND transporter periplasmic adaptor subunit [Chitinophaga sp.]|uniref:efflux RND transporter periplasmic adaptor subunit n=1 Tax=Chitinophaga sp. TaxID=1869181 RepID=UPI0025B84AD1|nr:efflux RND transporter periplasmic adaptor subunit [Chitinophaga sp.]MBV8251569.1 efflux RND transporter periplasmic adaptor subunit [Chitinophaga sp.]